MAAASAGTGPGVVAEAGHSAPRSSGSRPEASTTASLSSALIVQTEYTTVPPTSALRRHTQQRRLELGQGLARQRRSGRRARTPRPEHGASTSTRSKPARSSGSASASPLTTRTFVAPSRPRFSSSLRRAARVSLDRHDLGGAFRQLNCLRAGAAQRSSNRSPGSAATASPASCEPTLCGKISPASSAASSTRRRVGRSGRRDRDGPPVALAQRVHPDDGRSGLVLGPHQRTRLVRPEVPPPHVGDPVR